MTQIGQLHAFSKLLYDHLLTVEPGATVTYDDLSAVIGSDVQEDGYQYLHRARYMALRNDRMVFDCIRGAGLVRVENAQVVGIAESVVHRLRKMAKRGIDTISTIDLTKLSPEELTRAHVARAQMGLTRAFTANSAAKRLSASAEGKATLPNPGKIAAASLKAFEAK